MSSNTEITVESCKQFVKDNGITPFYTEEKYIRVITYRVKSNNVVYRVTAPSNYSELKTFDQFTNEYLSSIDMNCSYRIIPYTSEHLNINEDIDSNMSSLERFVRKELMRAYDHYIMKHIKYQTLWYEQNPYPEITPIDGPISVQSKVTLMNNIRITWKHSYNQVLSNRKSILMTKIPKGLELWCFENFATSNALHTANPNELDLFSSALTRSNSILNSNVSAKYKTEEYIASKTAELEAENREELDKMMRYSKELDSLQKLSIDW